MLVGLGGGGGGLVAVAYGAIALLHLLGIGLLLLAALLSLFFLQGLYHAVDGLVALFLGHLGEGEQGVLQVYRLGVGCQLVENLRAAREFLVVFSLLVKHSNGGTIAVLGIAIFLFLPIQVAEFQEQHAFLHTAAGAFLVAFLVCGNGVGRVFVEQIDIAHGIVDLVEIVLVVVVGGHALQTADGLLGFAGSHHLGHGDARIEVELIGRVLVAHLAESLVGSIAMAQFGLQLSEQEPLAGTLLATHLVLDNLAQVGDGTLVVAHVDVVVGIGVVPLFLGMPVDGVAAHVAYHVLGIVEPILLNIAFGQPGAGLAVDGRLGLVKAAHIREGGGGFVEGPLMEL